MTTHTHNPDTGPYSPKAQHCGHNDCNCSHTQGCDRGWILTQQHQAAPCRNCNYRRWYILTAGHNRDQAQRLLRDKTDGAPDTTEQTQGYRKATYAPRS